MSITKTILELCNNAVELVSLGYAVLFKQTLIQLIIFHTTALFPNYIPFSSHFLHFPFQAALVFDLDIVPPIVQYINMN